MWQVGATLHRGARASHYRGLFCCGAQAPDAQAQQLRLTGPVAPRHVGSSRTRAQTRVPCISRQTLNHCATREARFPNLWQPRQETQEGSVELLFRFWLSGSQGWERKSCSRQGCSGKDWRSQRQPPGRTQGTPPRLLVPVPAFASTEEESSFVACWRHRAQ